MAELKPDKVLADLQAKLAKTTDSAERATIQEQINARQVELTQQYGGNVGFGSFGAFTPKNAEVGTTLLQPTYEQGVYSKATITADSTDPYRRSSFAEGNKVPLFNAEGKQLTPAEAARTETGLNFAAAGWDIGYGPGYIAPGVKVDPEFASFNNVRANANVAPAVMAGYNIEGDNTAPGFGGGSRLFSTTNTSTSNANLTATTTAANAAAEAKRAAGQSAYNILFEQFQQYGLGALIEPLKGFIVEGLSPAEFTIRLRDTDAYKKRFAANAQRINKGLRALSEAEYIGLEDQYQNVMRNYGLPESYYAKGDMGTQVGFEKFIAGDVSAAELEDRIQTAQNRVLYANPEVSTALKQFYPDITNGDILAYALDPQQALTNIKRKVTAAEIGAGALQAGLQTDLAKAEALRGYGVTGEQARQGYQAIAGYLPRASTLGDIYAKQGMGPFTQGTAEAEVFGTPGAAEAAQKRRKLTELEQASFSGSAGRAGGALARERAGQFQTC